jgi:hypothetical protein
LLYRARKPAGLLLNLLPGAPGRERTLRRHHINPDISPQAKKDNVPEADIPGIPRMIFRLEASTIDKSIVKNTSLAAAA